MPHRLSVDAPRRQPLDAAAYQRMIQETEARKPHHFEAPKKVVSTADAVSAPGNNWTEGDISSKTETSSRHEVSTKLRSVKSFFTGFWGCKPKVKDDDECIAEYENTEYEDEDGNKREDSVALMPDSARFSLLSESARRPTSFLVKQIPGVSEVEAFSFARKSDPEDVMNGYQIGQGQAPLLAVSRYDQRISTVSTTSKSDRRMSTMSVTSKSERRMSSMSITSQQSERRMSIHSASHNLSIMNLPTRQLYAQQGNWTGSPSGAGGGAQGRAFSPPPVSSRSSKILPIEERPETGTPKSASLSCYSHSRPNPGGGLHVEKSALSIQTHNRRRSVLEPKSSKRSVECIGAEISLPCSSVSDMSFKLLPFEKNQPELAVQRSNLSLSCYSPSHPHCEHEGGLRAERSALSIQTHNRRRSVLEPKSSKRSVECIGAEISLPCSSVSDMSFKLLPFEKNQSELAVQRSNLSLSCYSPSHPRREGEGGLRAERSALSIQTHNRRRSNSNQNGSELSFECGGDGIPLNISLPNFSLRSPLGAPLTAEASLPTLWSEASTGTLSKKVGPRGGRKMSCTVESQFAHGLQPPKASKSQRRFSTSSVSFAPSEQVCVCMGACVCPHFMQA